MCAVCRTRGGGPDRRGQLQRIGPGRAVWLLALDRIGVSGFWHWTGSGRAASAGGPGGRPELQRAGPDGACQLHRVDPAGRAGFCRLVPDSAGAAGRCGLLRAELHRQDGERRGSFTGQERPAALASGGRAGWTGRASAGSAGRCWTLLDSAGRLGFRASQDRGGGAALRASAGLCGALLPLLDPLHGPMDPAGRQVGAATGARRNAVPPKDLGRGDQHMCLLWSPCHTAQWGDLILLRRLSAGQGRSAAKCEA